MPPRCQLLSGSLPIRSRALPVAQPAHRTFTTCTPLQKAPKGGDLGWHLPEHVIPKGAEIPPYPYGEARLFKQRNKGLYASQMIQFGNNVSPDTETKTRRHWKPNVLNKALYSVALKKRIKLRLTSKVLKTMDREGGLDEYLLKESETRIKELGPLGWALRWRLMQTPEVIARFRAEAAELGLPQEVIDKQWPEKSAYVEQVAAAQAREEAEVFVQAEAEAEVQASKDQDTYRRTKKYHHVYNVATSLVKRGVVKDYKQAERVAVSQVAEEERIRKHLLSGLFQNNRTALTKYRIAREHGQADDIVEWAAKYRAKEVLKQDRKQKQQEAWEKKKHEERMASRAAEKAKDWADLSPENASTPRAN